MHRRILTGFLCLSWSSLLLAGIPSDQTVEATSAAGAVVQYSASADGSAEDEDGRATDRVTCSPASGSQFPLGTTTVKCTWSSGSGTFDVTVVDTTAPALTLPDDISVPATEPGTVVTWHASAVDVVDGSRPVHCTPASGSSFPHGTTLVECMTADTRQNSSRGSFSVTVIPPPPPPPPPPPQLPEDITQEATGPDGAVVLYSGSGSGEDDENGRPTVDLNCSPPSGSTFPLGTTTVQCDGGTFDITVVDTLGPELHLPRDFTVFTSDSATEVTWDASATDVVDGDLTVTCSPASGSSFVLGATVVSCTSADTRGNSSSGTFTVTVAEEAQPPRLPDDITQEATGPEGAVVTYTAVGPGDDENGRPNNGSCSPASGSTFPLGTTTVQCAGGTFNVTIVDTTAPVLHLPADITSDNPVVQYVASAYDLVDGNIAVSCAPPSGSTFTAGATTTVHCSATDARNNSATGTFSITVEHADTEAPVFLSINANPGTLHPPNNELAEVTVTVEVEDNEDPSPFVSIFDVTANESITSGDWVFSSPLVVKLRATRDGQGSGRIYTVWIQAIDEAGNRSVGSVPVTVPHDRGNAASPPPPAGTKRRAVRP